MFTKKSAILCFYYMMSIDGKATDDEKETFEFIGRELDPDNFDEYKDELYDLFNDQISNIIDDDDPYDVMIEGVDKAIYHENESEEDGIGLRLFIWNLLVLAFSDDNYSENERRMIKHIVRTREIEKDIFLEMEQLMKTNSAISKEIECLKKSDKPYIEINATITELEERRQVILNSAQCLIEDELYTPVTKVDIPKNKVFDGAKNAAEKFTDGVVDKVSPIASNIGNQTKKIFGGLMTKVKGNDKDE